MAILSQPTASQLVRSGNFGAHGDQTTTVNADYVEEYRGEVEKRFLKESFMRSFAKIQTVRGTDTVSNHRMGFSGLQKVTRGVRPTDASPTFDNISVKVDTIVLARSALDLLESFQESIDTRKEMGHEHGREIGKFFDESFIIQGIKAAQVTNVDPLGGKHGGWVAQGTTANEVSVAAPEGFQGGAVEVLALEADKTDPDKLVDAILNLCETIESKDIDIMGGALLVRPEQYYTLLRNDKLINQDFSSGNGNFAQGKVLVANGIRIVTTNRFPKYDTAVTGHYLSNAGNSNAYDSTKLDACCVALFLMPKALLAGETIPLTTKVHYSDVELQWFVDAYIAYGVTPNRAEHAGGIWSKNASAA